MTNCFQHSLFVLAHSLGQPDFYPVYKRLLKNQWKPLAELKAEQDTQLRRMVHFCYDNVPYYHTLFQNQRIKPETIKTTNDLKKIPVLTKEIIKANWEELKPVNLNRIRFQMHSTGGSTGTPMKYRVSSNDRFLAGALLYRGWGYAGYKLSDKMVFLAGSSLDIGTKVELVKKAHEYTRNIRKLSSFNMGEKEMQSYAGVLNTFQPKYIRGYASSIYFFAQWLEENNIRIPFPNAVFTTAEKLYPPMRETIGRVFNCEVFDGYGLFDGGVSAYECPEHSGLHIDSERSVMELIDEGGNVIESGEGTILATSLHNFAMPFLRYDTGDIATRAEDPCSCGRAYPLLSEIVGRSVDVLITPEGTKVHGWFFLYIFWEHGEGIKEYQVVQETINEIKIKIVKEEKFNEQKLDIIRKIILSKSPDWNISFNFVDEIKRTKSGKYKFIINEVSVNG